MAELESTEGVLSISFTNDSIKNIVTALEKIGRVTADYNFEPIKQLTTHNSANVRALAVKNLAKSKDKNIINELIDIYENDPSTIVRREAISAIGRFREKSNIDFLTSVLADNDPKIVVQAIRALLVFKGDSLVDESLKNLQTHDNEMIRQVITKEYFSQSMAKTKAKPHASVDPKLSNVVVHGDVLDILKYVDDDSFHLTFTSPPYYNARDYSIYPSYDAYLDFLRQAFEATYRTTKEGRFLIVNTSPVIVPRISRAHSSRRYPIPFDLHTILVKMGWEFIDDIIWEKPEYSVKNRIGGFQQHRKPLAYKPNSVTEYLMVYRKKTDRLLDWNMHQYDKETVELSKVEDGFETTNVWKINPKSDKVHSAIFPAELCQRVVNYYSFKGDLIFDPFAGSGTLGRMASTLGRKFFLAEKEQTYFEYMKNLIGKDSTGESDSPRFMTLEEFMRQGDTE